MKWRKTEGEKNQKRRRNRNMGKARKEQYDNMNEIKNEDLFFSTEGRIMRNAYIHRPTIG